MQPNPPNPRDPDDADERAWQAIVDNYGDRAELDEAGPGESGEPPAAALGDTLTGSPFGGRFGDPRLFPSSDESAENPFLGLDPDDDEFVPPPPPPLPKAAPDRMVAWIGLFGSPLVLLVALLFSIPLPTWAGYGLIGGFVGGFGYLVATMSREPRDPWDDGAQV